MKILQQLNRVETVKQKNKGGTKVTRPFLETDLNAGSETWGPLDDRVLVIRLLLFLLYDERRRVCQ